MTDLTKANAVGRGVRALVSRDPCVCANGTPSCDLKKARSTAQRPQGPLDWEMDGSDRQTEMPTRNCKSMTLGLRGMYNTYLSSTM